MVPDNCNVVVDVGADHGILTKLMLTKNKAKFVYATDISAPSLKKAEMLIEHSGLQNRCSCVVSDGLNAFSSDFKSDLVVIAGMGGNEVVKILSNIKNQAFNKRYLLQPVQDFCIVREFLSENNFIIEKDITVEEKGKFYAIILCKKTSYSKQLSQTQCYFGLNCNTDTQIDYINFVKFTYNKLNSIKQYLTQKDLQKLQFCENILKK